MRHTLETTIEINAPIAQVWEKLTQFEDYPNWNPFIKEIKGEVAVGNQIEAQIDTMKFKPVVLAFDQEKEFTWKGKLLIPGIFDGKHSFKLQKIDENTTRFFQTEEFYGILVSFLKKKLNSDTLEGFNKMNRALKLICENNADRK